MSTTNRLKSVTENNIGEIIEEMELAALKKSEAFGKGRDEMTGIMKNKSLGLLRAVRSRYLARAPSAQVSFTHLGLFFVVAAIATFGATYHMIEKKNKEMAIASTISTTKLKIGMNGLSVEKVDLKQISADSYECSAQITDQGVYSAYSMDMSKACSLLMDKIRIQANKKPEIMV